MGVWRLGGDMLDRDTLSRLRALGSGVSYTGPGDIVSGATAWWGLRAYNAAKASAQVNAVDIIRASDSTTNTFTVLTNGNLDVASITTFLTSTTGKVTKLWDQTGNGNHLTQGTGANRPAFTLNAIGSLPAITFSSSFIDTTTFNGSSALSQPFTFSAVYKETSGGSSPGTIINDDPAATGLTAVDTIANEIDLYAGGGTPITVTGVNSNVWHAAQGAANGASSDMNVDGTAHTGTVGSQTIGTTVRMGAYTTSTSMFAGLITEVGIWPVAFTGTNSSNMSSNQHSYWGF